MPLFDHLGTTVDDLPRSIARYDPPFGLPT